MTDSFFASQRECSIGPVITAHTTSSCDTISDYRKRMEIFQKESLWAQGCQVRI